MKLSRPKRVLPESVLKTALMLLATFSLTLMSTSGWAQTSSRAGEIIVGLAPGVSVNTICTRYGASLREQLPGTTHYLLRLPDGVSVQEKLTLMASDIQIVFAGRNFNFKHAEVLQRSEAFIDQRSEAFIDANMPTLFYGQAPMLPLRMQEAHNYTRGNGVVVAVIDTGIDLNHPLFAGRIAYPNYDFVDNDPSPQEATGGAGYGHGTFVAGLIALSAPGAKIMPLRAFAPDGSGSSFAIAKAIRFAVDNGAHVINMSFGLLDKDTLIDDALSYAHGKAFMVASAGNDNSGKLHFPSSRSRTLCVTATDATDRKAGFSNFNLEVGSAAPGVNLYSAYPGGRYAWWSGTSFSTPLVTGAAALLLQLDLSLNRSDIKSLINGSGSDLNTLNPAYSGKLGKRLDYLNAVNHYFITR